MTAFLLLWGVVFVLPMVRSLTGVFGQAVPAINGESMAVLMAKSLGLAAFIATISVLLGAIPGRLLALSRRRFWLLGLLLLPLVLPRYVQYYAWSLLLTPTTSLGRWLSANGDIAKIIGTVSVMIVLLLWYWPLSALLSARGWKNIGAETLEAAHLETNKYQCFFYVILPLLWRNLILCFTVCFVLVMSEFAAFHLAGVKTIGTSLAVLYELTGSEAAVFRAAWPLMIAAIAAGFWLHREMLAMHQPATVSNEASMRTTKAEWAVFAGLVLISVVIPLLILITHVQDAQPFVNFVKLHSPELGGSLISSSVAVFLALVLAYGAKTTSRFGGWVRWLRPIIYTTIFAGMLLPGSLVGISLLKTVNGLWPVMAGEWWLVSVGQAVRVCGVALILLELSHSADDHHVREMAAMDGAGSWARFWYLYLPQNRPFIGAAFLLLLMMSITELPATMILLGAGVPNFAQRLLNQMHYARDDQVIASCLILIATFVVLSGAVVWLLRRAGRSGLFYMIAGMCMLLLGGCDKTEGSAEADVVRMFGATGRGKVEFIYPRAIDAESDQLYVIDKVGRIQRISFDGKYLGEYNMPEIEAGKPTGMSVSPEGNLYVADTHYHRILVFDRQGQAVREFGVFGEGEGEFIYPTDVAFGKDGQIFVSEYGGNDRISVFDKEGTFQYCFGEPGSDDGQFSRPSAICVDPSGEFLYIADACNHRIAVYTLDGQPVRYLGSVGGEAGNLRYPYDLAFTEKGDLVICEYGNNRIQVLDPQGNSLGVYGRAGRNVGELAYPWGVAVQGDCAYIVDAGNNRIQVWQF